jgi:hypothetical protein
MARSVVNCEEGSRLVGETDNSSATVGNPIAEAGGDEYVEEGEDVDAGEHEPSE